MESNAGGIFIAVAGIIGTAAFFYNKNTTSTKVSKTEAKVPRKMKTTKRKEKKIIKESKPINMADYINDESDTDSDEERRKEALKSKKKLAKKKKKSKKAAQKASDVSVSSGSEIQSQTEEEVDDGWNTVSYKKTLKKKASDDSEADELAVEKEEESS